MKVIGVIFIFFVFTFLGFYKSYLYFLNLSEIECCRKFLDLILFYLESNCLSVTEIFNNIEKSDNKVQKKFTEKMKDRLYSGKNVSADDIKKTLCKDNVSSEILADVLMYLGRCSLAEQIQKIKTGIKNIDRRYNEMFLECKQKAKLASSMGVISGLFVIVITI